jgi:formylglycine-generating enzyme required for sulfatase activity
MVEVTFLSGEAYCIDTTEVTVRDYQGFLESRPNGSALPPECATGTNDTFVPSREWPPEPGTEQHPVTWVDFCDAWAYCAWAGKRLCGKKGGAPNVEHAFEPDVDEWINACTRSGERALPYGDDYDPDACNVASDSAENVGARATCEGGFEGIFDIVGNLSEFANNCNGSVGCAMLGDSWLEVDLGAGCASNVGGTIGSAGSIIGFRCCRDAE